MFHFGKKHLTKVFLRYIVFFLAGKLFYLFDYRKALAAEPWTLSDLLWSIISGLRFDGSVAAMFLAPAWLLALAPQSAWRQKWLRRTVNLWLGLTAFLTVLLVISDHYFYLYFKDHFNVFFWEFFENFNNANLVVTGLADVVPLYVAIPLLIGSIVLLYRITRVPAEFNSTSVSNGSFPKRLLVQGCWVLLLLVAARGTFDSRPLKLQDRRIVLFENSLLNLIHTNPLYPLIRSLDDRRVANRYSYELNSEGIEEAFGYTAAQIPNTTVLKTPYGYTLSHLVQPMWQDLFERKPKQIVLLFLESHAAWITHHPDQGFSNAMGSAIHRIEKEGITFSRHFSPSGGTIKNIAAAINSFPQERGYSPSIVYQAEGYKNFPDRMPNVFARHGFDSIFFYGGVVAWHRLYDFVPKMGFSRLFGANSFSDIPKHEHGMYDGDLFGKVAEHLDQATVPQFTFVMSLTNHPPYNVPETFPGEVTIPSSMEERLIDERSLINRRFRAFRYVNQSLENFFKSFEQNKSMGETVFLITADHSFSSGIAIPASETYKLENLKTWLYAPGLIKEENKGKVFDQWTTHLDLMPTILSFMIDAPTQVSTWGKSMFAKDAPKDGINHYFSCVKDICRKDGQWARLEKKHMEFLTQLPDELQEQAQRLEQWDRDFYRSAMHYLYTFREKEN